MKVLKVLLNFATFSVSEKIMFFRNIMLKLTGNPIYLDPDPTLAELKLSVDELELAMLAAQDGGHIAILALHDHNKASTLLFRHLTHYVDKLAKGDETKILSSGFSPTKQPITIEKAVLTVANGKNSGTVHLYAKAYLKAGAYKWEKSIKENPLLDSDWEPITITTQSNC